MEEVVEQVSLKRKRENKDDDKRSRRKRNDNVDKEKERLEKLVLGDSSYMLHNMSRSFDTCSDSGLEDEDQDADSEKQFSDTLASPPREPAWHDDDDNNIMVQEALDSQKCRHKPLGMNMEDDYQAVLRRKFQNVFGQPKWAKLGAASRTKTDQDEDEDEDDVALLTSCGNFIQKKNDYLPKTILDIKRLASLNSETRNEGPVVRAVEFHPKSTVALVAGLSGVASIFQVDGRANNKLASVHFERFSIKCAKFTQDGNQFIVGSQHHSHFYCYDMIEGRSVRIPTHHNMELTSMKKFEVSPDGKLLAVCGKFGAIHLLTADTKEWISTLRMNNQVRDISFNSDGSMLYSHGDSGYVYMWDVGRRCCVGKFFDDGCIGGTSVAVSPCDQLLACGSASGVVNIYRTSGLTSQPVTPSITAAANPTPVKAVMNLVTPVTSLRFDSSSQILAMASEEKYNAVKLLHFPSLTVFSNFPYLNAELGRIQNCAFSPNSGYLSLVNNRSSAFLFRLRHFGNY